MSIKPFLLIALVLFLLLPIGVTLLTQRGLERMGHEIGVVIEEFGETQRLRTVDRDLSVALHVMQLEDPGVADQALERLQGAEESMIEFLAEQYGGTSSETHQAEESLHATTALSRLSELVGPRWNEFTREERVERTDSILRDVRELCMDAELGIQETPAIATGIRNATLWRVLLASLVAVGVCVVFAFLPIRGVFRRLRGLQRDIQEQNEIPMRDEPRSVAGVMNQIEAINERMRLTIEEKNRELLRRERMAGIGLLAADVAHEINNPMNAMLGLSELSLQTTGGGTIDADKQRELHESLTVIRREVLRCRGIIERLMAMVRGNSKPQWFDVNQLLAETVAVARAARHDKAGCFHVVGVDRDIRAHAPPQEVRQIILTLLINAADAITDDGRIEADVTRADNEIWLRVRDNGRGFTPKMQESFAVPFKTNRAESGGIGLGLSIAHTLSTDIGADLRSYSDGPGKGSLFLLALPDLEDDR